MSVDGFCDFDGNLLLESGEISSDSTLLILRSCYKLLARATYYSSNSS